jgi:hypothetical protein
MFDSRCPQATECCVATKYGLTIKCAICDDIGWVCEDHGDRRWRLKAIKRTRANRPAGMPCPICNTKEPPRTPPGMRAGRRRSRTGGTDGFAIVGFATYLAHGFVAFAY